MDQVLAEDTQDIELVESQDSLTQTCLEVEQTQLEENLEETAAPQSSTPTPAAPSSSTQTEDQVQEETNSQDL